MTEVYLDNAATTRALPSVVEAVSRALAHAYGNPSSLHRKGMEAEAILKEARGLLARILDVSAGEIVFTSGGDRKSTRLNSSHVKISYAVFCLKKKRPIHETVPHG